MIYRVYLLPVDNSKWPLKGGWLDDSLGQNSYIYGRTSKDEASTFTRESVVDKVRDCKRLGYPAKSDPPIIIKETI